MKKLCLESKISNLLFRSFILFSTCLLSIPESHAQTRAQVKNWCAYFLSKVAPPDNELNVTINRPNLKVGGQTRNSLSIAMMDSETLRNTPDEQFVANVTGLYPSLKVMTGNNHASPDYAGTPTGKTDPYSPSMQLFGEKSTEFDRSSAGVLFLKWVQGDDPNVAVPSRSGFGAPAAQPSNRRTDLSAENLRHAKALLGSRLKTKDDWDAMFVYMTIHDLGKSKNFLEAAKKKLGKLETQDHDKILVECLKSAQCMKLVPDFGRLTKRYQQIILAGLEADFNLGQFVQGENLPRNLEGLSKLNQEQLDWYLIHVLGDIAGAAGHVSSDRSIVMSDATYSGFRRGIEAIQTLPGSKNGNAGMRDAYDSFLSLRAKDFHSAGGPKLDPVNSTRDRAVVRLALMTRSSKPEQISNLISVFESLPRNTRTILQKELNIDGVSDLGILGYYSPATLSNAVGGGAKNAVQLDFAEAHKIPGFEREILNGLDSKEFSNKMKELSSLLGKGGKFESEFAAYSRQELPKLERLGLENGLILLARAYQHSRASLNGDVKRIMDANQIDEGAASSALAESGTFVSNMSALADIAGRDARSMNSFDLHLAREKGQMEAKFEVTNRRPVSTDGISTIKQLSQTIQGENVVAIGMGGGSDVVQAAQVAKLLQKEGKKVPFLISVRRSKTGSAGASGKLDEARTVENGREVAPGIYEVFPHSTGSGRFVENAPATEIPTYIVMYEPQASEAATSKQIMDRINKVIADRGQKVDVILGVDTGGDALYPKLGTGNTNSKTTPDQDIEVLTAINAMKSGSVNTYTAEVAVGVDSPENASTVLRKANSTVYFPTTQDKSLIAKTYQDWGFGLDTWAGEAYPKDGPNANKYGKTPLAWQLALKGERGFVEVPLPEPLTVSRRNTWLTHLWVDNATEGIFVQSTDSHLQAIANADPK